jgi:hypothetical protein
LWSAPAPAQWAAPSRSIGSAGNDSPPAVSGRFSVRRGARRTEAGAAAIPIHFHCLVPAEDCGGFGPHPPLFSIKGRCSIQLSCRCSGSPTPEREFGVGSPSMERDWFRGRVRGPFSVDRFINRNPDEESGRTQIHRMEKPVFLHNAPASLQAPEGCLRNPSLRTTLASTHQAITPMFASLCFQIC